MIVVTADNKLQYELGNVARLFFPAEEISVTEKMPQPQPNNEAVVTLSDRTQDDRREFAVTLMLPDKAPVSRSNATSCKADVRPAMELGKLLYLLLSDYTGRQMDWGVLTGIRPVKLARKLRANGLCDEEIERYFVNEYLTSPQKAALCRLTDSVQQPILGRALPQGYSLYISIPFCPTRCSYCSFVSHSVEKTDKLIPQYVEKLCRELEITAKLAGQKGLVLQTLYIGGGTPTTLSAGQLDAVLTTVERCFDLSNCTEKTVEAGRPDTITPAKLEVLQRHGVQRVSVNCQTLNDEILASVGRKHSAQDFFDCYSLVKTYGFTAINVDLIAGLPGELPESFKASLDAVLGLEPQNITVHSLTVKRAARLRESKQTILGNLPLEHSEVGDMVNHSQKLLLSCGYLPYYLYRQKGTVDSLENVGFCLPGTECLYNIYIMDETHTILSVGAGGVTKLVRPGDDDEDNSNRIQRIFNLKYPYEYLARFDTMVDRKQTILDL